MSNVTTTDIQANTFFDLPSKNNIKRQKEYLFDYLSCLHKDLTTDPDFKIQEVEEDPVNKRQVIMIVPYGGKYEVLRDVVTDLLHKAHTYGDWTNPELHVAKMIWQTSGYIGKRPDDPFVITDGSFVITNTSIFWDTVISSSRQAAKWRTTLSSP